MEREVAVASGVKLWIEESGDPAGEAVLLIMGGNASGMAWPDSLLESLASYRVVRYDHRDTGRSTWAFDRWPYALTDLAADAVRVLDALRIDRAHVVGMSMGGMLTQVLLLDHPERLRSATLLGASPMGGGPEVELPEIPPELLAVWETMLDDRGPKEELDWRVEHWRVLNGDGLPFDPAEFRSLEARCMAHAGTHRQAGAHALADQSGLDRGAELASVTVPTLVIESPADPIAPPATARYLASLIGGARLVTIPGLGHALPEIVVPDVAKVLLSHFAAAE